MLKTARDKVLAMVLPAIAIAALYALKVPDLQTRWAGAENALVTAQGRLPSPGQVAAENQKLADLNRQLAEVQKRTGEQEAQWRKLEEARKPDSLARMQTVESVTALLTRHRLSLVDGSLTEPGDAVRLPKSLEEIVKQLGEKKPELKPQLWRMRFIGRYSDVLSALEELSAAEPLAIPIHLQMAEARLTSASRSWTLYLWI